MKISLMALAAILAFGLAGCTAGVTAGSATFDSGPHSQRICTHSYSGHWQVPDNPDNGLREERQCVIAPSEDDDGD